MSSPAASFCAARATPPAPTPAPSGTPIGDLLGCKAVLMMFAWRRSRLTATRMVPLLPPIQEPLAKKVGSGKMSSVSCEYLISRSVEFGAMSKYGYNVMLCFLCDCLIVCLFLCWHLHEQRTNGVMSESKCAVHLLQSHSASLYTRLDVRVVSKTTVQKELTEVAFAGKT